MGEMPESVRETIQSDGDLYSLGWYLYYGVGRREAVLDGEFTAEELRAIADYMDTHAPDRVSGEPE